MKRSPWPLFPKRKNKGPIQKGWRQVTRGGRWQPDSCATRTERIALVLVAIVDLRRLWCRSWHSPRPNADLFYRNWLRRTLSWPNSSVIQKGLWAQPMAGDEADMMAATGANQFFGLELEFRMHNYPQLKRLEQIIFSGLMNA